MDQQERHRTSFSFSVCSLGASLTLPEVPLGSTSSPILTPLLIAWLI